VLAEWETRRPYLATVWSECQLWKSAPDAAFESSLHSARAAGQKKGHSSRQGRRESDSSAEKSLHSERFAGSFSGTEPLSRSL